MGKRRSAQVDEHEREILRLASRTEMGLVCGVVSESNASLFGINEMNVREGARCIEHAAQEGLEALECDMMGIGVWRGRVAGLRRVARSDDAVVISDGEGGECDAVCHGDGLICLLEEVYDDVASRARWRAPGERGASFGTLGCDSRALLEEIVSPRWPVTIFSFASGDQGTAQCGLSVLHVGVNCGRFVAIRVELLERGVERQSIVREGVGGRESFGHFSHGVLSHSAELYKRLVVQMSIGGSKHCDLICMIIGLC